MLIIKGLKKPLHYWVGVSLGSRMYLPINMVTAKYSSGDELQNRKRVKLNFSLTLSLNGVFLRGLHGCIVMFYKILCHSYLTISRKKNQINYKNKYYRHSRRGV